MKKNDNCDQKKFNTNQILSRLYVLIYILLTLGTLFRSARIVFFKSTRRCTFSDFLVVLCFEAMHVVGLALLIYVVLPELDVVKGAMLTNCAAFIPAVFGKSNLICREKVWP